MENSEGQLPIVEKKINPVKHFLAGAFGSIALVIVGHPADTLKVRLQTMVAAQRGKRPIYRNVIDCLSQTVRNEGAMALYKGVGSVFVGTIPMSSFSLFGYALGKRLQTPSGPDAIYSLVQVFSAGALAGVFNSVIVTPIDRVKCLLQVRLGTTSEYKGSFDCADQLVRKDGIRSLYRGFGITIIRSIPSWAVYLVTYEQLKRTLAPGSDELKSWQTILAGGTAGLVSWLTVLPADVLKSRLQAAPLARYPRGAREIFYELRTTEGYTALYRGATAILLRAFPANAAFFLGYEAALKMLDASFD